MQAVSQAHFEALGFERYGVIHEGRLHIEREFPKTLQVNVGLLNERAFWVRSSERPFHMYGRALKTWLAREDLRRQQGASRRRQYEESTRDRMLRMIDTGSIIMMLKASDSPHEEKERLVEEYQPIWNLAIRKRGRG